MAAMGLAVVGCGGGREVIRADPAEIVDLSARFNENDARLVADEMIGDSLSRPWLDRWREEKRGAPVVIVGTVRNDTGDYIDTALFTKQIERAFINSGRVRLVAARNERGEVRDERREMQDFSRPETVKKKAFEVGADLMMIGRVGEDVQVSRGGGVKIQYYQVNLELIDIESNEKVWIGEKQIEKRQIDK
jgi:uncharacterized protein (TIGR02722 family)